MPQITTPTSRPANSARRRSIPATATAAAPSITWRVGVKVNSHGWPKLWAKFNNLIGISSQTAWQTSKFWANPVSFRFDSATNSDVPDGVQQQRKRQGSCLQPASRATQRAPCGGGPAPGARPPRSRPRPRRPSGPPAPRRWGKSPSPLPPRPRCLRSSPHCVQCATPARSLGRGGSEWRGGVEK